MRSFKAYNALPRAFGAGALALGGGGLGSEPRFRRPGALVLATTFSSARASVTNEPLSASSAGSFLAKAPGQRAKEHELACSYTSLRPTSLPSFVRPLQLADLQGLKLL